MDIDRVVAEVMRHRRSQGWLVGGTVRDRRLGRFSPDMDVVVDDDPEAVALDLAGRLGSPWFPLSIRHGAFRVMTPRGHVDVAGMQGADILDDLGRRDFTVNAMALSLVGEELLDPFDGCLHLRAGVLVAVSPLIFRADPLRLMRAARFCHVLDLRPDPALETLLRSESSLVLHAAAERVTSEIAATLAAGRAAVAVRLWEEFGLLSAILPEVGSVGGAEALETLDVLLSLPRLVLPSEQTGLLEERLSHPLDGVFSRPVALRLALLLHGLDPEAVAAVGRRLKLSSSMMSLLRTVSTVFSSGCCSKEGLRQAARPGRAQISFLWTAAPWEVEVLLLAAAVVSSGPAGELDLLGDEEPFRSPLRTLLATWAVRAMERQPPVDGDLIMAELGLEPGPHLGQVLREVHLAWEAGEARSASALLEVAHRASEAVGV